MAKKEVKITVEEQTGEKTANAEYAGMEMPERFKDPRTFIVAGVCFMDTYTDKEKVKHSVVTVRMIDPFDDPDFVDVQIIPKWSNAGGLFKYRAKKKLREVSKLRFPVFVTPVTYFSKRAKKELTIAGLFIKNPFDEGYIEFTIPKNFDHKSISEDGAVFRLLCSERWQMTLDDGSVPVSDEAVE